MKAKLIIRMGAPNWDIQVKQNGKWRLLRNFRKMTKRERSDFHREFMNAFRANNV